MDPNRATRYEKMKLRRKARKSFSIPKKQRKGRCPATKPMILHHQSQERGTDETNVCPSTSAEFETIDEFMIPHPALFTACVDSTSVETIKIPVPIASSTLISCISRLHRESLKIPDVNYIAENDEQSNSSIDSISISDIGYSPGAEISVNSDKEVSDYYNDVFGGQIIFKDTGFYNSIDTTLQNRKHEDEIRNRFEVEDHYNSGVKFGEAHNIQFHTSKEKGKSYRDVASLRKKHADERRCSFEDIDQCYLENRFENVQNTHDELQKNKTENSPIETTINQRRGDTKVGHIIQEKLTNSNHRIRSDEDAEGRSCEDKNSFQESQYFQTDISKRKETFSRKAILKQRFNTSKKVDKSLSILENPTDHSRLTIIKHQIKVGNLFEDKDNFGVTQIIQTETPKKKGKFYRGIESSIRRENTDEKNSFEEEYYIEDGFENNQNIQDEELQMNKSENSPTETATYKRKDNKKVGHIIQKKLTNSNHRIGNEMDEEGRSLENAKGNERNSSQEAENMQDISKRKRTCRRRVTLQTRRRSTRSKKVVKSRRISKNHTDQEFVADAQNNQNEKEKSNWPMCCLTTFKERSFSVLQPVIRDDIPIDSITLMILKKNKKKCKH